MSVIKIVIYSINHVIVSLWLPFSVSPFLSDLFVMKDIMSDTINVLPDNND